MTPPISNFTPEQREEIKNLMAEALTDYFEDKGRSAKTMLITLATVIGSLAVILGGIKAALALVGFTYTK
jgi:hypothetical protein